MVTGSGSGPNGRDKSVSPGFHNVHDGPASTRDRIDLAGAARGRIAEGGIAQQAVGLSLRLAEFVCLLSLIIFIKIM